MKKYSFIVVLLLVLALLCGCSEGDSAYEPSPGNTGESGSNGEFNIVLTNDRLLVYSAHITLTVDNIDSARNAIDQKLGEYGGHFASYSQSRSGYFYAIYKVPTIHLEEFLNSFDGFGEVTDAQVDSEDITDRYTAVSKQKQAYEAQYETVEQLLEESKTNGSSMADREYLATRLVDLSKLIDQSSSQMQSYKSQAEYSTVYLSMYARYEYVAPSFWEELGTVLSDSTSSVSSVIRFLLKVVVALLPYAVLGLGIWGIYLLVLFVVCKCKHTPFTPFAGIRERRLIRKKTKAMKKAEVKEKLGIK